MLQIYPKLDPLLSDPKISKINCLGENIPLEIIRTGRKIKSEIVLKREEILQIFQKVSDLTNIPLLQGPINIKIENVDLEGFYSQREPLKFWIKKQTAYAILEEKPNQLAKRPPARRLVPRRPVARKPVPRRVIRKRSGPKLN